MRRPRAAKAASKAAGTSPRSSTMVPPTSSTTSLRRGLGSAALAEENTAEAAIDLRARRRDGGKSVRTRKVYRRFAKRRRVRLSVASERGTFLMRMMMHVTMPVETGNNAAKNGTLGTTLQKILAEMKPEAAYFAATESG